MNQQTRLEQVYGLPFPESFFTFWEFAQTYSSLLADEGIELVGPFDLLKEAPSIPGNPLWRQARYYNDPPEFLTIACGAMDGLHWGYYVDDPSHPTFPVASYFSGDAEISMRGDTLFEALRMDIEVDYAACLEMENERYDPAGNEERIRQISRLRSALQNYEREKRFEEGEAYEDKYPVKRHISAPTRDGMGIVVPEGSYIPLSGNDPFQRWNYEPGQEDVRKSTTEAMHLLARGYPGAALKLGKDLWFFQEFSEISYALLDAAYTELRRFTLRKWLNTAIAYRQECDAK